VITIAPEGNAVYVSEPGGLIYRSEIPRQWSGDAAEVYERLRSVTGLEFGENDTVRVAKLATESEWVADQPSNVDALDEREWTAIQRYKDADWEAAAAELRKWSERRPDDWIPLGLRITPLTQLGKFDEADKVWERLVALADRPTADEWLRTANTFNRLDQQSSPAVNTMTPKSARTLKWSLPRLLEATDDDSERAGYVFDIAKAEEVQLNLDRAADAINEAVRLNTDSADMHHYRAHLMERLNQWNDALGSREEIVRISPDYRTGHFRLIASHLFANDVEMAQRRWKDYVKRVADAITPDASGVYDGQSASVNIRDWIAKTRLIMGGDLNDDMRLAITLANVNFENERAKSSSPISFLTQCKGLADYRSAKTDEGLKASITQLNAAVSLFQESRTKSYKRGISLCRFYSAMAHFRLGDKEAARRDFLDGTDHHDWDRDRMLASKTATWTDWQLGEVARKEAQQLLGIDPDAVDLPVPESSEWTVLFEDNFDNSISQDWQRLAGEWSVVEGAACGTLKQPNGGFEGNCRLEREIPDLPSTFEVEYEVKTQLQMLAACILRSGDDVVQPNGHRVALTSFPDRDLVNQGKPGLGASLLIHASVGNWFSQSAPDFRFEPNRLYKVRILRQPQRITVFVNDEQILSERVRNIDTRSIRLIARGEEGMKMFVDNFRVRTPPMIPDSDKNNE
jgi:tetratricopeptide (TPR) repeat protein